MSKEDFDIGYGKPPNSGRFKKGKSGNPQGRPKKIARAASRRQARSDVINVLNDTISIIVDGKRSNTSRFQAMIIQLFLSAMKGNHRSAKLLFEMYYNSIEDHEAAHRNLFDVLENVEREIAQGLEKLGPDAKELLNSLRKKTKPI